MLREALPNQHSSWNRLQDRTYICVIRKAVKFHTLWLVENSMMSDRKTKFTILTKRKMKVPVNISQILVKCLILRFSGRFCTAFVGTSKYNFYSRKRVLCYGGLLYLWHPLTHRSLITFYGQKGLAHGMWWFNVTTLCYKRILVFLAHRFSPKV